VGPLPSESRGTSPADALIGGVTKYLPLHLPLKKRVGRDGGNGKR